MGCAKCRNAFFGVDFDKNFSFAVGEDIECRAAAYIEFAAGKYIECCAATHIDGSSNPAALWPDGHK